MRVLLISLVFISFFASSQNDFKIALLKYSGGGDWYANPTALGNLIKFCNQNIGTNLSVDYDEVYVGSNELFDYPFVHLTGHGNVIFTESDVENLKNYLISGGFLHIDDNYGLDKFIRREMSKVFPDKKFVEIPNSHPIFHQKYSFNNGLPKIHEHDNKAAKAYGIFYEGRLVCLYTYESDLGDGWEDAEVHGDPYSVRLKSFQMGANIINFVFCEN